MKIKKHLSIFLVLVLVISTFILPVRAFGDTGSSLVSVILGDKYTENGMSAWSGDGPGDKTIVTYDGKSGWQANPASGARYIYCNVKDDSYLDGGTNSVKITIEYYDSSESGNGWFSFSYDSTETAWDYNVPKTHLTGSNTWKTVTYTLNDAQFTNRENGADFRIESDVPVCIASVTVEKNTQQSVATEIKVNPTDVTMNEGATQMIVTTVLDQNGYIMNKVNVNWSSSDPTVATVDNSGKITAVKAGTTLVKAIAGNLIASVNVTVVESGPQLIRVDAASAPYGGSGSWSQNTKYPFFKFKGGGWWSDSWAWMYDGAGNVGDYVDFTFTGTSIALYMAKMDIGGIAKIYLDGNLEATVDTYSNINGMQTDKVFEKDNLLPGEHTLRVEVAGKSIAGNAVVRIEAFEYMASGFLFKPKDESIEVKSGKDVTVTILRDEEAQALSGTYDIIMPEGWSVVSGKDFQAGSASDDIVIHVPDNYVERNGEIKIAPKSSTGEQYSATMTIEITNNSAPVSVIFGTTPIENGITVWTGDGSGYTVETYDGKSGWQTKPGYGVIYGNVDDKYIYDGKHKVTITIEYYDAKLDGKQNFSITYDGVSYPWSGGPNTTTYLTGTNTWKTVTYTIDDVKFANRENGGDIRIHTSVPICFHSIVIEKIPIVTIEGSSNKPGNIFFDNEAPAINVSFGNQFDTNVDLTVNYYVLDYANSVVDRGTFNVNLNPNESGLVKTLTFGMRPKGTYTLIVNARSSDGSVNINEKYNFSVISDLTGKNIATFFGMNTHYCVSWSNIDEGSPLIKQAGATNIRDGRQGASATIDKLIGAGYKLLTGVYLGQPDPDGSYTTWVNQVVKPYAEEVKGKAEYFEIGNEPNGSTSPEEYVKMLKAAYPVIKSVDSNIKVVSGVAFGYDAPWLKKLIDLGALDYSDAMSFHIYSGQNPENAGVVNAFQDLRNYIASKGITKNVELLLTEIGYPTQEPGWGGFPEIKSAAYAAQLYITGFVNNDLIHKIYWYDFMNDGTDPTFYETNQGVVRGDLTAKPSFVALNAVSDILAGATYVKSYNTLDSNIRIYKFHRTSDNKDILVLWANNNSQSINLKLGSSQLRIGDIFGNFKNYDAINGAVTLTASEQPIYIEGNFTQDPVLEATPSFTLDTLSVTVVPGNDVTVKINRAAGAENLSGTYAVDLPVGWQFKSGEQFNAGQTTDTLIFTAPDTADIKTGEIRIYPTSTSGNIYGVLKLQINMIDSSLIEMSPQVNDSGNGYDLVVKITNRSNKVSLSGGKVTILQPADMAASKTFDTIAPNSTVTIKFAAPSLDIYTPTDVKVQIDRTDGSSQVIERSITSLTAVKAEKPINVDGVFNPDDWKGAMSFTLDEASQVKLIEDWGGPSDLSAKGYIKWDDNYLYMYVSVLDNVHYNIYPPSQNWMGDSIQFAIDPGRAQGPGILPHTENNIALRSDTGVITATGGFGAGGLANSIINIKRDDQNHTTNYEMAISWLDILPEGMKPAAGTDLGFSFLVNDNDGSGRRGWIEYMSGIGLSKDPTLYGDLILTDLTSIGGGQQSVPTTIKLNSSDITLTEGQSQQVAATVYDQNNQIMNGVKVSWSSDDPNIATVDQNGNITGVSAGNTVVRATYESISASVNVRVIHAIPGNINPKDIGTITTAEGTTFLKIDAQKAINSIKNTQATTITIDISSIGNTTSKVLEIPSAVIDTLKDSSKDIVLKSGDISIKINKNSIKTKDTNAISITISDKGREKVNANFIAVSDSYDISIKADEKAAKINQPIDVTFNISGAQNYQNVGVYYFNEEKGEWQYVGGKVDTSAKTITFKTKHFSKYAVLEYIGEFKD